MDITYEMLIHMLALKVQVDEVTCNQLISSQERIMLVRHSISNLL